MTTKERRNARDQECTLRVASYHKKRCATTDTTVLCHAPCIDSGTGYKGPDRWAAFGCYTCHDIVDRYRNLERAPDYVLKAWIRGIYETQKIQGVHKECEG